MGPQELLGKSIIHLTELAKEVSSSAYSPYSKFKVGCAILLEDQRTFTGCNVENACYGLTNCAERTAIFKAQSESPSTIKLSAVVIYTPTAIATMPCGACRQVIFEFGPNAIVVATCDNPANTIQAQIKELLPLPFGPSNLQR